MCECNNRIFFPIAISNIVSGIARTQNLTPMSVYRDQSQQVDDAYTRAIAELREKCKDKHK